MVGLLLNAPTEENAQRSQRQANQHHRGRAPQVGDWIEQMAFIADNPDLGPRPIQMLFHGVQNPSRITRDHRTVEIYIRGVTFLCIGSGLTKNTLQRIDRAHPHRRPQ